MRGPASGTPYAIIERGIVILELCYVARGNTIKEQVEHPVKVQQRWSYESRLSIGSLFCLLSLFSAGSILSIGSAGSILSIGSTGSILSIGSAGSILSIGSSGSILGIGRRGTYPGKK